MKIRNKFRIIYLLSITIIFVIFICISLFLKANYVDFKFQSARNYYEKNDIDVDVFAQYLIEKGFIVSETEFDNYITDSQMTCHLKEDELIVKNKEGTSILYATINKNIIKDTLNIVNVLLIIIFILLIILFFIIDKIIEKQIISRILSLEENTNNFKNKKNIEFLEEKFNDELTSLNKSIKDMIFELGKREEEKRLVVFALSHELRNQMSKIIALADEENKEMELETELLNLDNKVNETLKLYDEGDISGESQKNFLAILKEVLKEWKIKLINEEVLKEEFLLNGDINILILIANNICSNLNKYADLDSIDIILKNQELIIKNRYKYNIGNNSTNIGNKINKEFSEILDFNIIREKNKDYYYLKIKKDY